MALARISLALQPANSLMPSHQHEALLQLFRNRPALAPELLREALHMELPEYSDIRIDSADLTDIQPAEYRADLVVLLTSSKPVLGIVVEVQLSKDGDKGYVWPAYVFNLRSRLRCPAWVLVIAADETVARWALTAVEAGVGECCRFLPWVLGLSGVPEITDERRALEDPELAVLSAMAHARDPDTTKSTHIALLAQMASLGLDAERSILYCDLILNALPETARQALLVMNPSKYEYQSEFARRYFAQGKAEGRAEGEAEGEARGKLEGQIALILRLLAARYGNVSPGGEQRVRAATSSELDRIAERLLEAATLEEALGTSSL